MRSVKGQADRLDDMLGLLRSSRVRGEITRRVEAARETRQRLVCDFPAGFALGT